MRKSHKALFALSTAAITAIGLSNRAFGASITPGDLIVFDQTATHGTNSGESIQLNELTVSGVTVQTWTDSTLSTDSAASEGYLSLSNGGTQISYNGYTSQASTENSVLARAVGALNLNGTISYPAGATYNSTNGKNARSAYSSDGNNWYEGDQNSLYYNGTALTGGPSSVHSLVGVGGITYSFSGNNISSINPSSPTPGTTSVSLTPVATDPGGTLQDFTVVSSQNNGVYDTLYMADGTSSTNPNGAIYKFANISGTWTAEGSLAFSGSTIGGHLLEDITAGVVGGQVELFVTADTNTHGWLYEITDSAAFNSTISQSSGNFLAESANNHQFAGVVFVPEPAVMSLMSLAALGLLARRRRIVA